MHAVRVGVQKDSGVVYRQLVADRDRCWWELRGAKRHAAESVKCTRRAGGRASRRPWQGLAD